MMVFAQDGPEEGILADIIDRYGWFITPLASLVVIAIASMMALSAQMPGDDNGEDDENTAVEGEQETDPLLQMEEGVPTAAETTAPARPPRAKFSIAHEDLENRRLVHLHIDVENVNDDELCQLSIAVVVGNVIIAEKNWFIKPDENAEWNVRGCAESHGYTKDDPRIANAKHITEVWKEFVAYVEEKLDGGRKVGMILGWNGKGSEMTKFFKICEVKYRGKLFMPRWVKYFCDPQFCITHYTTCPLNEKKRPSQIVGNALGTCYTEAFGRMFDGAHNSANDARAQAELCCHDMLRSFLDKPKSVVLLDDVWGGKRARQAVVEEEPTRALPKGWEDKPETTFTAPPNLRYDGSQGGGVCGPSSAITEACRHRNLADLFSFFFTDDMLTKMAEEMNRYGSETHVREVSKDQWREHSNNAGVNDPIDAELGAAEEGTSNDEEENRTVHKILFDDDAEYDSSEDSDYELEEEDEDDDDEEYEKPRRPKKRSYLVECSPEHPDARKRAWGGEWIKVTPGMLLVFFGIMMITVGALKLRYWNIPWMENRGINMTYIQNMMTRDAFQQCKRFLHFVNNKKLHPKGHKDWTPLQKIQPFIDSLLVRFRLAYVIGEYISLDESMIKYKGKQVQFVQYMPAKPIKHGIKVFAICCGESGYIYGFYVYTGKQNDPNSSPTTVLRRLLEQDPEFLTNSSGRTIFMDNYYTSEEIMEMLFNEYSMFTVGTVRMTDKKSRTIFDFAFHKLSNAAKKIAGRGWLRWAQKKVTSPNAPNVVRYIVQCTTWMDNKQVGILHNIKVGGPGECSTYRYDREQRDKVEFPCHEVVPFYVKYMRGVDLIDRSMADWNVTLKTGIYYFRIFWYGFTAAGANMRITLERIVVQSREQWKSKNKEDPWEKYIKGNGFGWFDWMLDTGHAIVEKGIRMDWPDITDDEKRPQWMRKRFLPCSCKRCFHCKNKLTGRYGPPRKSRKKAAAKSNFVTPGKKRSTPKSKTPAPVLTKKAKKGGMVEVTADHVAKRVAINDYDLCCGVCLEEGRVQKPVGVKRSDTDEKFIGKTKLGCPHLHCREHPVCQEHWEKFKHKWSDINIH